MRFWLVVFLLVASAFFFPGRCTDVQLQERHETYIRYVWREFVTAENLREEPVGYVFRVLKGATLDFFKFFWDEARVY